MSLIGLCFGPHLPLTLLLCELDAPRVSTDTVFTCLFCNHEKAVSCKIDDKARIGYLSCKVCGQKFSADTSPLDQPIDVYSLWIDACEDVANEQER
ncbi:hypothetical protein NDA16_000519 [Ustilago loliicola]|nr:hypothetical protein NDA16_000519 [Ustilago loliicola]